ncbi:MAG: hypothetical protein CVV59_00895 [Tenericutes bacterium HGW-Tenericutes-4]|nr:MAG: hypothetical protein CVV59_00895 [Tenericutes bacterium HGW-Tenericutes-4]
MKFIKLTMSYMGKNFLYLFLMALIPAIFWGSTLSPFQPIEFINTYSTIPVVAFGSIFNAFFQFGWLQLLLSLVTLVLLAIFISAILGQIEQHFRSGKLNVNAIKDHVNNHILIVVANLVALFVIGFMLLFATSAILFLLHLLISGINASPTVFNVVVANVLLSIMFILYSVIASIIFVNTANMMSDGSEFRYSFSNSIKLTQKNNFKLSVGIIAPYLLITVLISLFVYSELLVVINIIGVLFLIMYYTSFAMTSYYELSKLDRYDKRKKYYRR